MMRGTVYLVKDGLPGRPTVTEWPVEDAEAFKAQTQQFLTGVSDAIEYGPIAPPWRRVCYPARFER